MSQSTPPEIRPILAGTPEGPLLLLALAPALYRVARRLTEGLDDASAVTRAAADTVIAELDAGGATRMRAYKALWQALQALWARQGALHTEDLAASSDELLLAELATVDEGELDRRLMARLDASPEVDLALRRLTAHERFAVLIIDVEDASREEVAAALDLSVSAVCAVLLHGRARVFASLVDYITRTGGPAVDAAVSPGDHPGLLALQDALDQQLTREARLRVDVHLAACAVCRRQLHALRWTRVRLAGVGSGGSLPPALQHDLARLLDGRLSPPALAPDAGSAPRATGPGRDRWRTLTRWFTSS